MNWNRFTFDYRLDLPGIANTLVGIEAKKIAAADLLLPLAWQEELASLNRVRSVHGSTALEGNPLSELQVEDFLADEPELDAEELEAEERKYWQIRSADAAQNWVYWRFKPGSAPVSVEDMLKMHETATKGTDEHNNVPGRLREHPVTVGTPELGGVHRCAPHEDLPRLMAEFAAFLQSRRLRSEHPVVRALLAHFFFATIHPFGDGNGRVARLVETAVLCGSGYTVHDFCGLSNYCHRNGDEYRRRLQESRKRQPFDVTPFVQFGLRGFEEELGGINRFINSKLNRLIYRDKLNQARAVRVSGRRYLINRRELALLEFLLGETEPDDPFSEHLSTRIGLHHLVDSPYVRDAYSRVSTKTFKNEVYRLAGLGFLSIKAEPLSPSEFVDIDFDIIETNLEHLALFAARDMR